MPYITQNYKCKFNAVFQCLPRIETPGELNYLITQLARKYILDHGLRYGHINAVRGAITCAGEEFYRRVAVPYEDRKIAENGDVYITDNGRCQ
jgi:hypothetical protein